MHSIKDFRALRVACAWMNAVAAAIMCLTLVIFSGCKNLDPSSLPDIPLPDFPASPDTAASNAPVDEIASTWDVKSIWRAPTGWKIRSLRVLPSGRIAWSAYDNKSRRDSKIYIDGKEIQHLKGHETAVFAQELDTMGLLHLCSEADDVAWWLNTKTEKLEKGTVKLPGFWGGAVRINDGKATHFRTKRDAENIEYDPISGEAIRSTGVRGLCLGVQTDPSSKRTFMAANDGGNNGLHDISYGGAFQGYKGAAHYLHVHAGRLYGAVGGDIVDISSGWPIVLVSLPGVKEIHQLATYTDRLVAFTSCPDGVWLIDPVSRQFHPIRDTGDMSNEGGLFDAGGDVRGSEIIWFRSDAGNTGTIEILTPVAK